jgi:hypothetical protein
VELLKVMPMDSETTMAFKARVLKVAELLRALKAVDLKLLRVSRGVELLLVPR